MASQITGYIGQINPGNGINYSIGSTVYGECNTAATTAAKTVDMTGFILIKGATIYVKFTNANTASSPTLNVQGTGAKPIIQNNFTTMYWPANTLIGLTYDGTNWVTNNLIDYNNFLQIKPKGGYYNNNKTSDNSIDVGAIKITLPVPANSNNNAMLNFQVVIYHYNSKDYVTYYISGYPFENTWHPDRCNAYSISNVINSRTNATIRYGNDGTNLCITIGEENTSWKWSQIYITNVYVGYTNITQEKYKNYMDGNWNISFSSTDPVLSTIDYTIENPNILTSITNAINNLDVSNISGFGKGRTLSALSETNGKISATFQDIEITTSQVSDFPSSMPASDVSSWAKQPSKPSYSLSEITSTSDIQAIEELTGTGFLKRTGTNDWSLDTSTYVTSSGVTSVQIQATSPVVSSVSTSQTATLNTTISLADNYGDTKNPYSTKNRNLVLASGTDTDGVSPSFRKLVAADLPDMYWANIKISSSSSTSKSPAVANLYIYNNEKQYARFYVSQAGTTTTNGRALLILGNNVASETDGNAHGRIKFYGYGTNNTNLQAQAINSDEKIVYLPDYNGNMYLIHAANNDAVGSNYQPIYADSYGRIKSINYTIQTSVPQNALFTDEKVKQTSNSSNANYKMLFTTVASPTSGNTYETYYNSNLIYNPSTNKLSTGNLDLSGQLNVTGATTLSDNVTIGGSLTTNSLTVNGNSQFNNSVNFNSLPTIGNQPLLQALGLSNALHFIGITSTTMVDGRTTATVMIGSTTYTPQIGDVVLYDHREYVWTSTATNGWEMLGSDASIMSAAGTTAINANQGIVYISQDSTGTINAVAGNLVKNVSAAWMTATSTGSVLSVTINGVNTTSAIPIASDSQSGVITTDNQTIAGIKNFKQNIRLNNAGYIGGLVDGSNRYLCLGTTDGTTDTRYIVLNSSSLRPNSTVAADIDLGSSGQPWKDLYALNNYIYNNNKKQVGRFGSAVLGTTTTNGETRFVLGNSTGSGSDNNSYGTFYLYGTGTRYAKITYDGLTYHTNWHIPSYGTSANEDIYFTHTGGTSSVGSDTQPVYVAENGRITTISSINIDLIAKASTTAYGITKLSSATDSTAINVAATPAAVKAAYDAATTAATNSAYAGSVKTTSAAKYNTEPEVKSIKITGNTSANTTATNGVVLQYDTTLKVLNFVFA